MNKISLVTVSAVVAVIVLLQSNCQAAMGMDAMDTLKAQFLPPEYRNMNITVDNVKNIYREKCKKVSGIDNSTLYQEIEKGAATLMACVSDLANVTALQEEIEKARPLGDLDMVFQKYCSKAPQAQKCLAEFNVKVQPCLNDDERKQNAVVVRVATSLLGFMCAKGGGQIALFVAEKGPECIDANKEALNHCMNKSLSEFAPNDDIFPNLFNIPQIALQPEHCVDLDRFESCVLHYLERCNDITPANVVGSVFRFVKNETNCKSYMEAKASEQSILRDSSDGSNGAIHLASGITGMFAILSMAIVKQFL